MTDHADLELTLYRRDTESYGLDLRFSQPGDAADVRLSSPGPTLAQFDAAALAQHQFDPAAYGNALGEQLLADRELFAAVKQALAAAASQDATLRLRLFVGPSAPELHALRWEQLRLPGEAGFLATDERTLFSRYLSSSDWRPVRLRPEGKLRALIAVAGPEGLEQYDLAAVDAAGEVERAKAGLGDDIATTVVGVDEPLTLQTLVDHLRDDVDILYLVAHGRLVKGGAGLYLADEEGEVATVRGEELITRLHDMETRPRLVVLASCQSASQGGVWSSADDGALAALGPRLAEIGVPAVVAMQGNVSMETVATFTPRFFAELRKDGQVDRALAVARGAIRDSADWWAPALFMRLKNGRLWYTPGFGDERGELAQWKSLVRNVERGNVTPILGPGLNESLLGSRQQIAQRWAETYHFPMAPHQQDDLPQVTQFMAANHGEEYARDELGAYLREQLLDHVQIDASDPAQAALADEAANAVLAQESLGPLFSVAWKLRRLADPPEPHSVLAQLPLPIFITTDPTRALFDALCATDVTVRGEDGDEVTVKKAPRVELCRWNEYLEYLPSLEEEEPDYTPSAEQPLIYHLFGNLDEPDSLVLTEDDYFDFLIGVTSNKDLIPALVRRRMVDSALLFLGFRLDDWDFRVLFRSIMQREGRGRRKKYAHVAAQVNPEEGRILEPERAREYLETYFQDAAISIFWGGVDDFIAELVERRG